MPPISLERARAAKRAAAQRFRQLPSLTGVGITRIGGRVRHQTELERTREPGVTFPSDIDGVPLCVEVTGTIMTSRDS